MIIQYRTPIAQLRHRFQLWRGRMVLKWKHYLASRLGTPQRTAYSIEEFTELVNAMTDIYSLFDLVLMRTRVGSLLKDYVMNKPMDTHDEQYVQQLLKATNKRRAVFKALLEYGDLKLEIAHHCVRYWQHEFELFLDGKIPRPITMTNL